VAEPVGTNSIFSTILAVATVVFGGKPTPVTIKPLLVSTQLF
jgi:hypothetical protein